MAEKVPVENLTKEKFKEYGEVITAEDVKPRIEEDGFTFWNNLATMKPEGDIDFAFLKVINRKNNYRTMERHTKTEEAYLVLDSDVILFVALTKNEKPDFDTVKAFHLEVGKGVVLSRNTWHWLPYPLADLAHLLVLNKKETLKDDLEKIDIKDKFGRSFILDFE